MFSCEVTTIIQGQPVFNVQKCHSTFLQLTLQILASETGLRFNIKSLEATRVSTTDLKGGLVTEYFLFVCFHLKESNKK